MPGTGNPLPADTARALQPLSTLRLSEHSMDTPLQAVVDATKTTLPRHVDASISVLIGSRPAAAACRGQLALDLDGTRYERGHGPCLHAAVHGELIEIADARAEDRWGRTTRPGRCSGGAWAPCRRRCRCRGWPAGWHLRHRGRCLRRDHPGGGRRLRRVCRHDSPLTPTAPPEGRHHRAGCSTRGA